MKSTSELTQFEDYLLNSFKTKTKLDEAMYYTLSLGGKRFRPYVMFEVGKLVGVNVEALFDLACAIEYIHTYSLIHDDLPAMDNDLIRRGKKTNHLVFGEDLAILAGDGLQALAFSKVYDAMANGCDFLVLKYFSKACFEMVYGQSIDIDESYKQTPQLLNDVHLNKTGALLMFSVIAPLFYIKKYDMLEDLALLGYNIGMIFQIQDDMLEVLYSSEQLGKDKSDEANQKVTYVSFYSIEACNALIDDYVLSSRAILSKYYEANSLDHIFELLVNRKR